MKKALGIWLMAGFFSALMALEAQSQEGGEIAFILKQLGDVQVRKAMAVEFAAAQQGEKLGSGDSVLTGADGFAALIFTDDQSLLKIRANSRVAIQQTDGDKTINVGVGVIWAKTTRPSGQFIVATPTSVASVKGTTFFLMVDENGNTRVLGVEGLIELLNLISGESIIVGAGQLATSTLDGLLDLVQTNLGESPPPLEEGEMPPAEPTPPPPTEAPPPEAEAPPEEGFQMNGAVGATVIAGETYQSLSLRPDIPIWKFGIGLDITVYFDNEGNIRTEDWDDLGDIIEKIYYIRYAHKGDPLYVRVGALPSVTLGYGLLMNRYSNAIEWPERKRIGAELGIKRGPIGVEFMANNFREMYEDQSAVINTRLTYDLSLLGKTISFGVNQATDINMYSGLLDSDNDGIPDEFDEFPGDDDHIKTDFWNGALPDTIRDLLIDEGRLPDITDEPKDYSEETKSFTAVGGDIGIPIFSSGFLNITLYGQAGAFLTDSLGADRDWGIAAPGISANFWLINLAVEYRYFQQGFISEFFDFTYELERATIKSEDLNGDGIPDTSYVQTKYEKIKDTPALSGIFASLGANILDFANLNIAAQIGDTKNIYGSLGIKPNLVPKVSHASAYYQQNNIGEDFHIKSESTILGYRIGYAISPSTSLVLDFRETYVDLNGDGEIGEGETVRVTSIETVLSF